MSEGLTKELFADIVAINKPKLICTINLTLVTFITSIMHLLNSIHTPYQDIETRGYNLSKVANRESVFIYSI